MTEQGLYKILVIKASINRGFSDNLKATFPQIIPVEKPNVLNPNIKDPNWLAGFTSGEGCFYLKVREPTSYRTGFRVELIFQLTQHSRDLLLLRELVKYLGCGRIYNDTNAAVSRLIITRLEDLNDKVIPFFLKYQIQGVKYLDYLDFVKVAELMKNKTHTTAEGVDIISKIKANMNKSKKF